MTWKESDAHVLPISPSLAARALLVASWPPMTWKGSGTHLSLSVLRSNNTLELV
ncbi:unnamed protein product [Spirodela intermedia]|uniref:Uncharacterized protein n=1 Tax=Spirodela intermedia TaxID=51605 RepID=A0A7I8JEH6_SPIIN|nr:unnamed protein product [Spirodela intermedia]CAA6668558.1 unnamed protein product [Spirodela intermedia]